MIAAIREVVERPNVRQFFFYALCGGTGVLTDITSYSLLVYFGIGYQVANAVGYAAGTFVSFLLNRRFTFKIYDKPLQRLALFFGTALFGYLISSALLWLQVEHFGIHPILAKLVTLGVVLIVQFLANRSITFRN